MSPAAIAEDLLKILVCPDDHAAVRVVEEGTGLQCDQCRRIYPIRDGIPVMLIEEARQDSSPSRG